MKKPFKLLKKGLIEIINKRSILSHDDLSLLKIITKIISIYMKNSLEFSVLEVNQDKLTKFIQLSFKLFD